MSKTSQRKLSASQLGVEDAKKGIRKRKVARRLGGAYNHGYCNALREAAVTLVQEDD